MVDEDVSRRTVALSINAGKLTARTLAHALQSAGRKIAQERRAHKTPHGKQTVAQLMAHGEATSSIPVDGPKDFDRVARRFGVDYAFYQSEPGKYLLFFKSKQADAITACFSEYSRSVLTRAKTRKVPVREQLAQAAQRVRRQPKREQEREVERER